MRERREDSQVGVGVRAQMGEWRRGNGGVRVHA